MEQVEVCCCVKNEEGKFVLYPRTQGDASTLKVFVDGRGRWVNVRLMNRASTRTRTQDKTFWALFNLYCQSLFGRRPSSDEIDFMYEKLRPMLFPVRADLLGDGTRIPKSWSQLTKAEGIEVIDKLMRLVIESENVPDDCQLEVRDIFRWVQSEKGGLRIDPADFHDDGTPLTKAEWAERNPLCMIRGIKGGDICHIVSRQQGMGLEWLVNMPWNFYRGSHDIHIEIQHRLGWDALFNGTRLYNAMKGEWEWIEAPWLKPRVERAFRLFYKGRELSNSGWKKEEIIAYLSDKAKSIDTDSGDEKSGSLAEAALS